jgi:hypothetical protein
MEAGRVCAGLPYVRVHDLSTPSAGAGRPNGYEATIEAAQEDLILRRAREIYAQGHG